MCTDMICLPQMEFTLDYMFWIQKYIVCGHMYDKIAPLVVNNVIVHTALDTCILLQYIEYMYFITLHWIHVFYYTSLNTTDW